MTATNLAPPLIAIVGCGPGALDCLTDAARQAAAQADILVGSRRLLELFSCCGAEKIEITSHLDDTLERAAVAVGAGRTVAFLVSGDPGMCSFAGKVLHRFGRAACRIVPGISSVQIAFARLGLSWADARIISAHGRLPHETADELAGCRKIAVLAGSREAIGWLADLGRAINRSHVMYLCENLTLPGERVEECMPSRLLAEPVASLAVFVLVQRELL